VGRSGYQLANGGHHTLAAAIAVFGKDHRVSVQLEELTDAQMLTALAAENAGKGASFEERVDTVLAAKAFLEKNTDSCKVKDAAHPAPSKFARGKSSPSLVWTALTPSWRAPLTGRAIRRNRSSGKNNS
jgi:hypothetical protein